MFGIAIFNFFSIFLHEIMRILNIFTTFAAATTKLNPTKYF